jgi:hypothetical protein
MDINVFWSWDYSNKMDITNRDYGNNQCQQQDVMRLTSQASPDKVPAAVLPVARPRIEALCPYSIDSVGCIKFTPQYC